jgi:hypothetical protein
MSAINSDSSFPKIELRRTESPWKLQALMTVLHAMANF